MRSFEFARKKSNDTFTEEKAYPNAQLPEYQTKRSAGADFFAAEDITIPSLWTSMLKNVLWSGVNFFMSGKEKEAIKPVPTLVHTGIKASMYEDEVLELYNRSSNPGKKGLILANSVGIVDADYYNNPDNDGEIMFAFYNFFPFPVIIKTGDRIGQGIFKKFLRPEGGLRVKDSDRESGFGSTDKKEK